MVRRPVTLDVIGLLIAWWRRPGRKPAMSPHFTMMLSVIRAAGKIQVMNDFLEQIRQLPIPEQLLLVEQIWEGLPKNAPIVQDWHREEGRRRLAELDGDPLGTLSRADVWKRVDERVNE